MMKKILVLVPLALFFAALSFFGIQFVLKTGIFKIPGELIFAEDFPEKEKEYFSDLLKDVELKSDLNLKLIESENLLEKNSNTFLLDIFVPTADYYFPENIISAADFKELYKKNDENIISVSDLTNKKKLLAVETEENYFLETFSSGAIFKYLELSGDSEDSASASEKITPTLKSFPEKSNTFSLLQTGVTALSRGMTSKLSAVEDATYFTENIADFIKKFDFSHTSNEASFTNLATSANICSKPEMINVLTSAGIDIVELTGNHNLDCGADAALETLGLYKSLNIKTFGGGESYDDAKIPLELKEKGTGVTLLGFNESTGGATTGDYPGANQYYEEVALSQISEAKEKGDLVIVDVQYYECNAYDSSYEDPTCDAADSSAGDQIGLFRSLIDMGADLVVGTAAHQPQTFEVYNNGIIYYGLGNLFFDQYWWPGTTRSLALASYFYNGKLLQVRPFGTVYDSDMQTRLMDEEELAWFLNRLNDAR